MRFTKLNEALQEYLSHNHWNKFSTDQGTIYDNHAKTEKPIAFEEHDFLKDGKRRFVPIEKLYESIATFFRIVNYRQIQPLHIVNTKSDTLFTTAGVQVFNSSIAREDLEGELFIAQPVLRTQFIGYAKEKEGYSTSFVNICTEKKESSEEDFIKQFDDWLTLLSKVGIYAGNLTLTSKMRERDWKKGKFNQLVIHVNYKGLELGDASYSIDFPVENNTTNICDVGFGLERIVWAINKTDSFYDSIWPGNIIVKAERETLDNLRTATLLASSGVLPENKAEGYRLRKALKGHAPVKNVETTQLIEHFYDFWSIFTNLQNSLEHTKKIIFSEVNRNRNLEIMSKIGISPTDINPDISQSELAKLLLNRNVDIEKLRKTYEAK